MISINNIQRFNIININGIEHHVESIDANSINGIDISSNSFSAVKMDEKRLYDFGFNLDYDYDRWSHENLIGFDVYVHGRTFSFGMESDEMFCFTFHTDEVHTFQNAFNLLAGNQYI